jgi:hypothetical protein
MNKTANATTNGLRLLLMEDAIEYVYDRKGSEDLTIAEACEAVRELGVGATDEEISAAIRRCIPYWF